MAKTTKLSKTKPALKAKAKELGEIIEILGARILSFVLPPVDVPRYMDSVEEYEFEISTAPQSTKDYHFRFLIYINCKVIFTDNTSLDCSIQSEVRFRMKHPVDESKPFLLMQQDPNLIESALGIAYSTTRGIMAEKARGTLLEGAILPIMRPVDLMITPDKEEGKK